MRRFPGEQSRLLLDEEEGVVDLLSRLEEGLLPLATNLNAKKVQLGKLEAEVDWGSQLVL